MRELYRFETTRGMQNAIDKVVKAILDKYNLAPVFDVYLKADANSNMIPLDDENILRLVPKSKFKQTFAKHKKTPILVKLDSSRRPYPQIEVQWGGASDYLCSTNEWENFIRHTLSRGYGKNNLDA